MGVCIAHVDEPHTTVLAINEMPTHLWYPQARIRPLRPLLQPEIAGELRGVELRGKQRSRGEGVEEPG